MVVNNCISLLDTGWYFDTLIQCLLITSNYLGYPLCQTVAISLWWEHSKSSLAILAYTVLTAIITLCAAELQCLFLLSGYVSSSFLSPPQPLVITILLTSSISPAFNLSFYAWFISLNTMFSVLCTLLQIIRLRPFLWLNSIPF
jgi:hypothetical protein